MFMFVSFPSMYAQTGSALGEEFSGNYYTYFGTGGSGPVKLIADLRDAFVTLLKIVLVICSLGSLVLAAINMMGGEPSGAKRFFLWGIGLAVGLAVLSMVSGMGYTVHEGEGFAGLQGTVAALLEVILSMVCMVTVSVVVVHIMNGEKDGFQKFLRWMLISGIGLALIEVFRQFT